MFYWSFMHQLENRSLDGRFVSLKILTCTILLYHLNVSISTRDVESDQSESDSDVFELGS